MRKANIADVREDEWKSPLGKFHSLGKTLNEAIAPDCASDNLRKRHPFEVELTRIPPGVANWPFHFHSNQWEFYLIVSGKATVRDESGVSKAGPGDFFMFGPLEVHQIINQSDEELVYYCIADNPVGGTCYYPDSDKWSVGSPGKRKLIKGQEVEYLTGEEEEQPKG